MPPAFALSQDQTLQFRVRQRSPCGPRIFTRMSAWHNRYLPKQITIGHLLHQLPMQLMPGRRQTCRLEFQGSHILEAYPTVHFSKSDIDQGEGSPWPPASVPLVRTRGLYPTLYGCQTRNVNLGKSLVMGPSWQERLSRPGPPPPPGWVRGGEPVSRRR